MKRLRYSIRGLLAAMLLVAVVSAGIHYVVNFVRAVILVEAPAVPARDSREAMLEIQYEMMRGILLSNGSPVFDPDLHSPFIEYWVVLLWEGNVKERCVATFILGALCEYDSQLTPFVQDAMTDEDPEVREAASYVLDRLK